MPTIAQSYLNAEEQLRRRGWLGSKSTCLQCCMTNSLPFTVIPMVSDQAYIQAVPLSPYLGPCSYDRREGTVCYRDPLKVYCFFLFFLSIQNISKMFLENLSKHFKFFFLQMTWKRVNWKNSFIWEMIWYLFLRFYSPPLFFIEKTLAILKHFVLYP